MIRRTLLPPASPVSRAVPREVEDQESFMMSTGTAQRAEGISMSYIVETSTHCMSSAIHRPRSRTRSIFDLGSPAPRSWRVGRFEMVTEHHASCVRSSAGSDEDQGEGREGERALAHSLSRHAGSAWRGEILWISGFASLSDTLGHILLLDEDCGACICMFAHTL